MKGPSSARRWWKRHLSSTEITISGIVIGIIAAAGVAVIMESVGRDRVSPIPDFGAIENTQERKDAFFGYLLPLINQQNGELMEQRARILECQEKVESGESLSSRDRRWLIELKTSYRFDESEPEDEDFFKNLLSRVDAIPPSLALAQAANESGWGTSRFAREGNNFYGIWCYTPGCGIVPKRRPAGATYEVTRYKSPAESVAAYFRALNTGDAYLPLRRIRAQLRTQGRPIGGVRLADGLEKYSERGMSYVRDIQALIQSNNLGRLDV